MIYEGVVLQADFTPLDKMVHDNRLTTKTTQTRPHIANAVFAVSGFWPRCHVYFDRMNQIDVAEFLVELFEKYGKPDQVWVDGGGELTAKTIRRLCEGLGIRLYIVKRPQQNGVVEARNKFVNDTYSRTSAGDYTGANLNERPEKIIADRDIETVQRELDELRDEYNHTVSADDGLSPLERFERFDNTVPLTNEERLLVRRLMLKHETRQIQKYGINLFGKTYWFVELGTVDIYSTAGVWFDDRYGPPEEIYVELPDGRIVMACDQDRRPPSPSEINDAKRLQREYMNQRTKDSKTYKQAEKSATDEASPTPPSKINGMDVGSSVPEEDGTIENASDAGNYPLDDDYQNILKYGL